ncbi:MAG: MFS transporter [Alphaproteobacteria bacterium]|nr:MFS transporter [Alphaproteobacteria bacterium]
MQYFTNKLEIKNIFKVNHHLIIQVFAALGHFFTHLCTSYYFTIVLAIEKDWGLPYINLLNLWTLGSLLFGLGSILAGWLADKLNSAFMILILFLGLGLSSIGCGLAQNPTFLMVTLSFVGLFASIYHPVGIPWLMKHTTKPGKVLGLNGIFGTMGISGAGFFTGLFIAMWGWRLAFIIPGVLCLICGLLFSMFVQYSATKRAAIQKNIVSHKSFTTRHILLGLLLLIWMTLLSGLVLQSIQLVLPKVLSLRLDKNFNIGYVVAIIYAVAGIVQYFGSSLIDYFSARKIYSFFYLIQIPLIYFLAGNEGIFFIILATLIITIGNSLLPAESILISSFSPEKYHNLSFGVRFVISFSAQPLAILFISWLSQRYTNQFYILFIILACCSIAILTLSLLIPKPNLKETRDMLPVQDSL